MNLVEGETMHTNRKGSATHRLPPQTLLVILILRLLLINLLSVRGIPSDECHGHDADAAPGSYILPVL